MISLKMTFPKLDEIFKNHEKQIMEVLAATMQTNRAMMFDKDGADNGKKKWKNPKFRKGRPLQASGDLRKSMAPMNNGKKPAYTPNGILKLSGNSVRIGTNLIYARLMNDGTVHMAGGVLVPVNAKALKIPVPPDMVKKMLKTQQSKENMKANSRKLSKAELKKKAGIHKDGDEHFMFRKSVKIPARPMDQITKADEKEWAETLANFIAEVLNNG